MKIKKFSAFCKIWYLILILFPLTILCQQPGQAYEVEIKSVVTDECPKLMLFVTVSDQFGVTTGLENDNFIISDNEKLIPTLEVTKIGDARDLDIAILIDNSGSMGIFIDRIKVQIDSLVAVLSRRSVSSTWTLISFGNGLAQIETVRASSQDFLSKIRNLPTIGETEDAFGALKLLNNLTFRNTAQRLAIILSDEPFQERGMPVSPIEFFPNLYRARSNGFIFYSITSGDTTGYFKALADSTNGATFIITQADFPNLIKEIITPDVLLSYTLTTEIKNLTQIIHPLRVRVKANLGIGDGDYSLSFSENIITPSLVDFEVGNVGEFARKPILLQSIFDGVLSVNLGISGRNSSSFKIIAEGIDGRNGLLDFAPLEEKTIDIEFNPTISDSLDYTANLELSSGCLFKVVSLSGKVKLELNSPNAFTPNGDNINDIIEFGIPSHIQEFEIVIQNRWSKIIRRLKSRVWDGTNDDGTRMPSGVYFYAIQIQSQVSKNGTILLLR